MKGNEIVINQILHGYANGHSLIAGSTQLDSDVKKMLLVMSDMSGSSMQKGFEQYITGYPIRSLNAYALAKTWYAPEMKRPGCVWTHTLLIEYSDLAKIETLDDIFNLFRRPSDVLNVESYQGVLSVSINLEYFTPVSPFILPDRSFVREVITNLYNQSTFPVLIKERNSQSLQNLVTSIWLQQWPRLRRNFSFCTGSISVRMVENVPMDLQIIPYKAENSVRNSSEFKLIDPELHQENADQLKWVDLTVDDISYPSEFRYFLKRFGSDVKTDREVFKLLTEAYLLINERNTTSLETITFLGQNFSTREDGNNLKVHLLSKPSSELGQFSNFLEEDLLCDLSTTNYYDAFDYVKICYNDRFKSLYYNDREKIFQILNRIVEHDINPFGEKALIEISEMIEANDLILSQYDYQRGLLLIFVSLNPKLAYQKVFWENNRTEVRAIISALIKVDEKEGVDWQRIIFILIEIDSDFNLELIEAYKIDVAKYTLTWLNENGDGGLRSNWLNVLRRHPEEMLSWMNTTKRFPTMRTLNLIVSILNPNSKIVIMNGSKVWIKILSNNSIRTNYEGNLPLKAFVLALAFNKPDSHSLELLAFSFERVYEALFYNRLDDVSWSRIEFHTKPLSFWKDWDRCKKIIDALFNKFSEINWNYNNIRKIAVNESLVERIETRYRKF